MIIEQIVTNLAQLSDDEKQHRHLEKVFIHSDDLVKRIQRVVTDHGNEIGISLREPKDLMDGDVLFMDDHTMIVISVLPDDLLIIRPRSLKEMGEIAHKLGNRHLPAQFEEDRMIMQYDYLVEETLKHDGIPYSREEMKVKHAFRHVGHKH